MPSQNKEIFELKHSKTSNLCTIYKLYNFIITDVEDFNKILNPSNLKCKLIDIENPTRAKLISNAIWFCEKSLNELKENAINYQI